MALPPKDDPQRSMIIASRYAWVVGLFVLALSLVLWPRISGKAINFEQRVRAFIVMSILFYVPGILYIVCAIYLPSRAKWAIALCGLPACFHIAMLLIFIMASLFEIQDAGHVTVRTNLTILLLGIAILLVCGLIVAVSNSWHAIRQEPDLPKSQKRGFEPIFNTPTPESNTSPHSLE